MNYFANCTTAAQAKQRYKQWCKILHPDKGGTEAEFQAMQDEYNKWPDLGSTGKTKPVERQEQAAEFDVNKLVQDITTIASGTVQLLGIFNQGMQILNNLQKKGD